MSLPFHAQLSTYLTKPSDANKIEAYYHVEVPIVVAQQPYHRLEVAFSYSAISGYRIPSKIDI
jgi:hypothetical protein